MNILPEHEPQGEPALANGIDVAGVEVTSGESMPLPIPDMTGSAEHWAAQMLALYPRGESPTIDHAERALRTLYVEDLANAQVVLPLWRHYPVLSPRERLGVLARFMGPTASVTADLHRFRTKLTRGGAVVVWCACGEWDAEAGSEREAARLWASHKDTETATGAGR